MLRKSLPKPKKPKMRWITVSKIGETRLEKGKHLYRFLDSRGQKIKIINNKGFIKIYSEKDGEDEEIGLASIRSFRNRIEILDLTVHKKFRSKGRSPFPRALFPIVLHEAIKLAKKENKPVRVFPENKLVEYYQEFGFEGFSDDELELSCEKIKNFKTI